MIPDFDDPVLQAEDMEEAWDRLVADLPVCNCCGHSVYPGNWYHETRKIIVCGSCLDDLIDNPIFLEDGND
jgi:hypothetical protein